MLVLPAFAANAPRAAIDALHAGFRNPPPSQNLSPYWFWNGKITAEETRRRLRAMAEQGVQSATVMNWAGLEPAYQSEEWWREVGSALESARSLGMTLNFSDEYLWPSGQAWDYASLQREPSKVLQQHPEFHMRRLTVKQLPSTSPHTFELLPEVIAAARLLPSGEIDESSLQLVPVSSTLTWTPPAGNWRLFAYTAVEATERGVRTDLLNPAAVRAFLDITYEQYARRFPQHLGSTIRFFVSDHEGSYGAPLPYTPALWDTFRRRHNYDLRPLLPLLQSNSARAIQVRQDYLETVSHLYATNYVQQITDWCSRHRVQHGHSDIEETLLLQVLWTGDMMQLWRASSAIFIDALIERARMPIDFQEALSVAHFENRPLMVETHGLLGHDSFFSLEKSRRVSNMAVLWGSNRLIAHYFEYDPTHLQYPPSNFLTQPFFRYFRHYSSNFNRALYLNGQGSTMPAWPFTIHSRAHSQTPRGSSRRASVHWPLGQLHGRNAGILFGSAVGSCAPRLGIPYSGQPLPGPSRSRGQHFSNWEESICALSSFRRCRTSPFPRRKGFAGSQQAAGLCWRLVLSLWRSPVFLKYGVFPLSPTSHFSSLTTSLASKLPGRCVRRWRRFWMRFAPRLHPRWK